MDYYNEYVSFFVNIDVKVNDIFTNYVLKINAVFAVVIGILNTKIINLYFLNFLATNWSLVKVFGALRDIMPRVPVYGL